MQLRVRPRFAGVRGRYTRCLLPRSKCAHRPVLHVRPFGLALPSGHGRAHPDCCPESEGKSWGAHGRSSQFRKTSSTRAHTWSRASCRSQSWLRSSACSRRTPNRRKNWAFPRSLECSRPALTGTAAVLCRMIRVQQVFDELLLGDDGLISERNFYYARTCWCSTRLCPPTDDGKACSMRR